LTQTPTAFPPTPTITPVLDPGAVSGNYKTGTLTLADGRQAVLKLSLSADHTARLEFNFANDPSVLAIEGNWVDNGDGSLSINYSRNDKQEQIVYKFKGDQLTGYLTPSFYGDQGINMQRILQATPIPPAIPAATSTSIPAANIPQPTPPSAPNPLTRPFQPFCGSAALVGVGLVIFVKKRPGPGK
ncbi:MAG: hypothetical protein WCP19_08085, partial [Chloroflexota bacterium]